MADEELAPEGGEALELAPETEEKTETTDDPIATLASEMGWTPQDQWRGEPEKWKPAADFIRAGHDIQRTLSRELKGVKQEVERFGRVAADITEERVRQRDEYWRSQHTKAVEEGDVDLANKAVAELSKAPQQSQPGPSSEVSDWVSRNEWFNKDPLAAMRAREVTDRLAAQGLSVPQQLEAAERAIRKEFPEHFPAPTKQPPATQTGASRKAAPSNRARGFADMPAESQQMARDFMRRNGLPIEKFAESYWADIDKSRRVG